MARLTTFVLTVMTVLLLFAQTAFAAVKNMH